MREVDTAYENWKLTQNPSDLHRVVKQLQPEVSFKLGAMGLSEDSRMRHQANLFAADAVKSYDPSSGVKIGTWVQSNLQSLQRFNRMNGGPVKVPDRIALDSWAIEKAKRELFDETGDDPDVAQLADRSKLSVARIAKVRKSSKAIGTDATAFVTPGNAETDYLPDSVQYVYDESDGVDRKLIELTTGFGGVTAIPKSHIAIQLKMSPAMVTRRTARLAEKITAMEKMMEGAYQ